MPGQIRGWRSRVRLPEAEERTKGEQKRIRGGRWKGLRVRQEGAMTERAGNRRAALIFRIVRIYNGLYWREK